MPISELIEHLEAIRIEHEEKDVQVWIWNSFCERCPIYDVSVSSGDGMIQVMIS